MVIDTTLNVSTLQKRRRGRVIDPTFPHKINPLNSQVMETYYKEVHHDGIIYDCTLKLYAQGNATLTLERNPKSEGHHWLDGWEGGRWVKFVYEIPQFKGTFEPSGMFILDIKDMERINY